MITDDAIFQLLAGFFLGSALAMASKARIHEKVRGANQKMSSEDKAKN